MKQHRLDRLLEARSLEEVPADDAEVAAIWAAALREWADAAVPGLSVAGAFLHVYQAAFRAATAVVRAAGYRSRGAVGGHHYVTFYALAALSDGELQRTAEAMQGVRGGRRAALYGDEEELDAADLNGARENVAGLLQQVHRWLSEARPRLGPNLPASPASPQDS
jgi:hypothetical protein